jgi:hypothetical protein
LPTIDLPALVFDAMPPTGALVLGWDHMLNAPIQWVTNGTETTQTGWNLRTGFARVRVAGRITTVLRKIKEELPWSVTLEGQFARAPDDVEIRAGGDGDNACFGSLNGNCTFTPEEAFKTLAFTSTLICKQDSAGSDFTSYYRLVAPDRTTMIAAYTFSAGSGGESTWLTISVDDGKIHASGSGCDGITATP